MKRKVLYFTKEEAGKLSAAAMNDSVTFGELHASALQQLLLLSGEVSGESRMSGPGRHRRQGWAAHGWQTAFEQARSRGRVCGLERAVSSRPGKNEVLVASMGVH